MLGALSFALLGSKAILFGILVIKMHVTCQIPCCAQLMLLPSADLTLARMLWGWEDHVWRLVRELKAPHSTCQYHGHEKTVLT